MGPVVLGKAEAGSQVLSDQLVLLVLDILDECIVHGLGGSSAGSVHNSLLALLEKLAVSVLGLLVAGEVLVADLAGVDAGNVDLLGGGDGVDLVDAFEGHAVDLLGAGNEQQARVEPLEANNSVATVSAGKKDKNLAGLNTLAQLGDTSLLSAGLSVNVLCGIPLELFDH